MKHEIVDVSLKVKYFSGLSDSLVSIFSAFHFISVWFLFRTLCIVFLISMELLESLSIIHNTMDLSKTYDYISHDLLIAKLEAYGLDRSSLRLMLSHLSNRIQRVKIGTCLSKYGKIKSVIPQGSVLGPLIFDIFINDMFYMNLGLQHL